MAKALLFVLFAVLLVFALPAPAREQTRRARVEFARETRNIRLEMRRARRDAARRIRQSMQEARRAAREYRGDIRTF